MTGAFIPATLNLDLAELLMTEKGLITPVHYELLAQFSQADLSAFCHYAGVYQVPTVELIHWLKEQIGNSSAMEIGAGNGCIGRALGIKMVDNYQQTTKVMEDYHSDVQQPVVQYGADVIRNDANRAIKLYGPRTVIGCWVTGRQREGKTIEQMSIADVTGVDELLMFKQGVRKYIHVGVEHIHRNKLALLGHLKVTEYRLPWIMSRSMQKDCIIYVFEK